MRRSWRLAVVAGIPLVAFAAGGTLTSADETTTPTRFCEVVTLQDAQAQLGTTAPKVTDTGNACSYTALVGTSVRSLTVAAGPTGTEPGSVEGIIEAFAGAANLAVRRIDAGDEAWAAVGAPVSEVIARSGDRYLALVWIDQAGDVESKVAAMTQLMRDGLARYRG